MGYKIYTTRAFVLKREPHGESDINLWLLSDELGLVLARAQGARKLVGKMRAHIQTGSHVRASLVRGRAIWRLTGAEAVTGSDMLAPECITNFSRVNSVILRTTPLSATSARELYPILERFSQALHEAHDKNARMIAELYAVAWVLVALGYIDHATLKKDIKVITAVVNKSLSELPR